MDREDFERHLRGGESATVEFKRCGNAPGKDVFETICSFSNRLGGNIFLGVTDSGDVVGVGNPDSSEVKRNIINVANNPNSFGSAPSFEFEDIEYEGKKVIRLWVPCDAAVHRYKGIVYDRVYDEDVKIVGESQLAALYLRKQSIYTERRIYPYLTINDLRADLFDKVRSMVRIKSPGHPWVSMTNEELLRSARLYSVDYQTGQSGLTLASALLFGDDEVIGSVAPGYMTDAIVRLSDLDRYDDRLTTRTNLLEAYELLVGFCAKHLPDPFHLEGGQRVSVRDIVVRELVSNLLMHREYSSSFPAKIIIDSKGLRTENASRTMFEGRITLEDFNPMPKNPILADLFTEVGLAEKLGSGTRNLFRCAPHFLGSSPELIEGDIFRASIHDSNNILGTGLGEVSHKERHRRVDVGKVIIALLGEYDRITVAQVAEAANVTKRTARTHLNRMMEEGALQSAGTTKDKVFFLEERSSAKVQRS